MARFDFIRAGAQAYEFVWRERIYLFRMAVPVLFVKIACLFAVFLFVQDGQILREGLFLMPSYIVEAIFAVYLIRLVAYGEPILSLGHPVPISQEFKPIRAASCGRYSRGQAMKSGVVVYILISLFYHVVAFSGGDGPPPPTPEQLQDPAYAFGSVLSIPIACIILIAIARFFFAYVPFALGYSFPVFLQATGVWLNSMRLVIGLILCIVPSMMFMAACLGIVSGVFVEGSAGYIIVDAVGVSLILVVSLCLMNVYMTYGLEKMLSDSVTKHS